MTIFTQFVLFQYFFLPLKPFFGRSELPWIFLNTPHTNSMSMKFVHFFYTDSLHKTGHKVPTLVSVFSSSLQVDVPLSPLCLVPPPCYITTCSYTVCLVPPPYYITTCSYTVCLVPPPCCITTYSYTVCLVPPAI